MVGNTCGRASGWRHVKDLPTCSIFLTFLWPAIGLTSHPATNHLNIAPYGPLTSLHGFILIRNVFKWRHNMI